MMCTRFSLTEVSDGTSLQASANPEPSEVQFWVIKDEDIEKYLKVAFGTPEIPGLAAFVSKEVAERMLERMLNHPSSSGNLGLRAVSFDAACEIVRTSPVFKVLYIFEEIGMGEEDSRFVRIPIS